MFNEKGKNIIIAVAAVVITLLLVSKCTGDSTPPLRVERYTDTIVKTHIDTVRIANVRVVTKTVKVVDTVHILNDSIKILHYGTEIDDSLISGTIDTYIKQEDTLVSFVDQKLTYTPKFPKYINRTDSVFIKDSIVVTKTKSQLGLLGGLDIHAGQTLGLIPKVGVQFKKGLIVEGGYDIINKNVVLGVRLKLNLSR